MKLYSWYRKVVSFSEGGQGGTGALCVYMHMMFHQPKTLLTLSLINIRDKDSITLCEQNEIINVSGQARV